MREKLIDLICSVKYGKGSLIGKNFQKGFIEKIADHLVANDVEQVVRCKSCKHCTVTADGMVCECVLPTKRMMDYYIYGSTILARVEADDFCSHGERKDNAEKCE